MQSLASYGSDSDDASSPVASTSNPVRLPPVALPVNRLRATAAPSASAPSSAASSKTSSPLLSGVVSTSRHATPTPRRPPAAKPGSASPPPHARASAPRSTTETRNDQSKLEQDPRTRDDEAGDHDDRAPTNRGEADKVPNRTAAGGPEGRQTGDEEPARPAAAVDLDSLREFGIPPIATGPCNPAVQAKLANFDALRRSRGLHFNDSLSSSKAFRNPRIYTKLVEFMDVDETGSCFAKDVWNSREIGRDGTSSRIAELQKLRSEAKQASVGQPNSRTSINFTSSSSSTKGCDMASRYRERDERDRAGERDKNRGSATKRSRWDNGGGGGGIGERSKSPTGSSSRRR
ncbi:hypothetical protein JCM11491_001660 [Sporobolomyces phaffii]